MDEPVTSDLRITNNGSQTSRPRSGLYTMLVSSQGHPESSFPLNNSVTVQIAGAVGQVLIQPPPFATEPETHVLLLRTMGASSFIRFAVLMTATKMTMMMPVACLLSFDVENMVSACDVRLDQYRYKDPLAFT